MLIFFVGCTSSSKTTTPQVNEVTSVVVSDFAQGIEGWASEAGWDYSHGKESGNKTELAEVTWDSDNQRLKMLLDYSKDSASGWSEAKVTGNFDSVDLSKYNTISFMLTYPSDMPSVRTKLFMKATDWTTEVVNAEGQFDTKTVKDLGNGWSTAIVRGSFQPVALSASSLTIGIVGPYANLDCIFIDNVMFSQADASGEYVMITGKVTNKPAVADISKMATTVTLIDAQATDETKALAAYLIGLQNSNQVLFGHQNSSFRSVRYNGEISDIMDITGSEAGLFGIDTLALTGVETSTSTRADALKASVAATKKAYEAGSIITLSCHMPNFANRKVREVGGKYGYDFTSCDFGESKDLTPCADFVLEGGKYNAAFNAYLDIIVEYAKALEKDDIPVLFRPFHENSGSWFWWGTSTSVESYKAMWRYMVAYLKDKGVHNFLYVYSPNGPFSAKEDYLERFPGDEYVDIIAFDYYDDYADVNTYTGDNFFKALDQTCALVAEIAKEKGKIPALSETGIRITGAGKDSLMVSGNPTTGKDWYNKVIEVAVKNDIPYFLLWANFEKGNFFVPFKHNENYGQEMINEFISSYNNEKSIFGNGTNFYGKSGAASKADSVTVDSYNKAAGYMIGPKDYATIKEPCKLEASVINANSVSFVVSGDSTEVEISGTKAKSGNLFTAELSAGELAKLGKTSIGEVKVIADGTEIGRASFINFNKDPDTMPQNIFDNFEFYYGNDSLLQSKYGSHNSAANCSSTVTLSAKNKAAGNYGVAFNYTLAFKGSEVWTGGLGRAFEDSDFSAYTALSLWVVPDGTGQKLVIQLVDGKGGEYEYFLTEEMKTTKAQQVVIPFTKFIKKGTTDVSINPADIAAFKIWCNSIPGNYSGTKDGNGNYTIRSVVYFDEIEAVKAE